MSPDSPLGQLRAKAGFTSSSAAKALGVSKGHINNIECGRSALPASLLERMAKLYQTPPEDIAALHSKSRKLWAQGISDTA